VQYGTGREVPPQLFDLLADAQESQNLAPAHPEAVAQLDAALKSIIDYPSVAMDVAQYQKQQLRFWVNATGKGWEAQIAQQQILIAQHTNETGAATLVESKDVVLTAPDIAENGAVVHMGVSTALTGVKHLLLLVEKNPLALVALFQSSESLENNFLTRAKMGQTSDVYAVAVMADGKALWAKKEVKVTLGGCGG
jgi:sulfur-oxidizing protein SoxY